MRDARLQGASESYQHVDSRERKMRMVERLGTVYYAMQSDNGSGRTITDSSSSSGSGSGRLISHSSSSGGGGNKQVQEMNFTMNRTEIVVTKDSQWEGEKFGNNRDKIKERGEKNSEKNREIRGNGDNGQNNVDKSQDKDGENRVVKSAKVGMVGTVGVTWLDDCQLAQLSTSELEDVMDRYLLSTVKQLVQVWKG